MKEKIRKQKVSIILGFFLLILGILLFVTKLTIPSLVDNQTSPELNNLSGIYDAKETVGEFNGTRVLSQFFDPSQLAQNVLGSTSDNKRIEVDLAQQRLYAFEGDKKIFDFLISSGKWGKTPTGTFRIWIKLRYTRMSGGNKELGTYYNLPNVPFTMFFANDEIPSWRGFGIHGTYWHSNFGHPMSHGCINMKTEEVQQLYYWANPTLGDKPSIRATEDNPGTPVIIYGTAPSN